MPRVQGMRDGDAWMASQHAEVHIRYTCCRIGPGVPGFRRVRLLVLQRRREERAPHTQRNARPPARGAGGMRCAQRQSRASREVSTRRTVTCPMSSGWRARRYLRAGRRGLGARARSATGGTTSHVRAVGGLEIGRRGSARAAVRPRTGGEKARDELTKICCTSATHRRGRTEGSCTQRVHAHK